MIEILFIESTYLRYCTCQR